MNLNEKDKPIVKRTIVVYSGRFQPFHKGHYVSYLKLAQKFGKSNVYIGTSNDTSGPKSPFNFNEKVKIITTMFGIPEDKIVQVRNPYAPKEILSQFDGKTTAYVAAVGEKDADRLAGKYFKPYNEKAGYGYDEIGYVYAVPAESNPISGTDVRNWLGKGSDDEKKKGFLKAYPKFDKEVFGMITGKLNENGFPGGIGTGLNLPGGYINGAPTGSVDETNNTKPSYEMRPEPHPTRHQIEHPTDELYNPIAEIIGRVAMEEMFEEFTRTYFKEESEAEKMGLKHLGGGYYGKEGQPASHKSEDGKIRTLTPAEADAVKKKGMAQGPSDAPANQPKPSQPGQPVNKGATAQGKVDATKQKQGVPKPPPPPPPPPPQKLSGAELKASAEKSDKEKKDAETSQQVTDARKGLSKGDNESIDKANNPQSEERKGAMNILKKAASYVGHGIMHTFKHNKEMLVGTASAIKSLATTGRFGAVKDSEGKTKHWDDFTEPDSTTRKLDFQGKVKPKMKDVPVYKEDKHGHPIKDENGNPIQAKTILGKPKTKKEPVYRKDLTPEQRELAEKSWNESQKQKKGVGNFVKTSAIIMGSIATTGGLMGGISAASKGAGFSGIAQGAGAKIAAKFGGGHLGSYIVKDIIKHSAFEALGANAAQASAGGIALGVAGIFENKNGEQELDTKKFVPKFIEKTLEIMQNYKLSDEQLMQTIARYKKEGTKNQSMANASDLMKENLSETKQQSIQNFVEFATKRLKLKETPKITLVGGREFAEAKTSLGGYNPDDKSIYVATEGRLTADILRTLAHEMVHRKQDELGLVKNAEKDGADGSPIENQAHAVAGVLMREYGRINKQIYNEVSNIQASNTADVPDGSFIKKGKKRKLDSDRPESWYANGGYTQTDFPKADAIFGDEDAEERTIKYTIKNLPSVEYVETDFVKEDINLDVDKGDEVLMGKFKNKRVTVKDIGKDDHGMPTINGKKATTFRIPRGESVMDFTKNHKDDINTPVDLDTYDFDDTRKKEPGHQLNTKDTEDRGYEPVKKSLKEAQAVSGGKVHKFITGKNLGFKGKKYSEIDFETIGVDNKNGTIRVKVLAPKEIFGNEMSLDFRGVRRGPFFKTDTGKLNEVKLKDLVGNQYTYVIGNSDEKYLGPNDKKYVLVMVGKALKAYLYDGNFALNYLEREQRKEYDSFFENEILKPMLSKIDFTLNTFFTLDKNKLKWNLSSNDTRKMVDQIFTKNSKIPADIKKAYYEYRLDYAGVKLKESVNLKKKVLTEGGAYGHMSHPFDDMDLTFGDLKNIITGALTGELELTREKTDGQALAISWKNGRLIAARNKGHLANGGANAMGIEDVASKFSGRGGLTDAYNFAMKDLSAAIQSLSEPQRKKIFNEGHCFMNLEVIWPTSVNVIPYGQALLVFHNTTCYDESGKAVSADQSAATKLAGMIKQVNADVQSKYTIQGPPVTQLPKNENLSSKQGKYLSKLQKLQSEFQLSNNDGVSEYHQAWWSNFVDKSKVKLEKFERDALIKRWAFGDKSFRLNAIVDKEAQKWAMDNDKVNVTKQQKENVRQFEEIFLGVGADVLSFMSSVLTANPNAAVADMKNRLESTAEKVRGSGDVSKIAKLKMELSRLASIGGKGKIVPNEGIVFVYKGNTYKLTGTFAPLNQILGIFYE